MCNPIIGLCNFFLALCSARLIQTHHFNHPLGTFVPPRRLRLAKGRTARGVLNVYQVCAWTIGEADEGTRGAELRVQGCPVQRCRASAVLRS